MTRKGPADTRMLSDSAALLCHRELCVCVLDGVELVQVQSFEAPLGVVKDDRSRKDGHHHFSKKYDEKKRNSTKQFI